ncbi:MAG: type 4a pilus biogenesis protein PilO [Nitrospirae bacterium]|nr:type 4a pilus biogenesis protein PilO [Nitrospirota bacterium]
MILSNLSKRERCIFFISLAVVFLALSYNFLIEPLAQRWTKVNAEIVRKEMELERNLKIISEKKIVFEEYKKYAEQVKAKGSDEEEIATLLQEVETIAARTSVRLTNVDEPPPVKKTKFYKLYGVKIELEAPIGPLTKFIYQLEKSPQVLSVQQLRLSAKSSRSSILQSYMLITKILIP